MYTDITSNKRKTWVLMTLFIGIIIAIGWALSVYFESGPGLIVFATMIALVMALTSYYSGDGIALATAGAHEIKKEDNPYVYRLVENLTITAGLPMPKIYIMDDPALNAFATGRDPQHASIALTTGIIESLENEELEGVIAHELSHIGNYDIRLMMVVIVCIGIVTLLADFFMRSMFWGGGGRRRGNNQAAAIALLIGVVLAILAPIFARLIQFAVSRKREFLADASGALLTRYPEGLARALEKIKHSSYNVKRANRATAHLYISDPLLAKHSHGDTEHTSFAARMFSTHPPINERIAKLRSMA